MINVVTVKRTCLACPSQWEGAFSTGEYIYARYRGGHMRVDVAPSEEEWNANPHTKFTVYKEDFGHWLDGYITFDELKEHTAGIVEWPESDNKDDWHPHYENDELIELMTKHIK